MSTATITPAAPSERRAAANRLNAQKSTGPRTPEGKARSALNALKHGVTARTPLIPSDDPEEFVQLSTELLEDLDPQTAVERELADRIVGLCWRRRRLSWAEEQIIARHFGDVGEDEGESKPQADDRIAGQDFLASQFDRPEGTPLLRLAQHERRLNGAMDSALRLLLKLQDRRERREGAMADTDVTHAGNELPVQNEPTALSADPLLTAARRAELPPDPQVAPVQNEAIALPRETQPYGLALKGGVPHASAPVPNEPTAVALTTRRAPAQNEAIAAAVATTVAEVGWGRFGGRRACG